MADQDDSREPDFDRWLRRYWARNIEADLLGVAEAGAEYLAEIDRIDPAHKARLSKRRSVLESAIQAYVATAAEKRRSVSEIKPSELERLTKLHRLHLDRQR